MKPRTAHVMSKLMLLLLSSCFQSSGEIFPLAQSATDVTLLSTEITFFLQIPEQFPDDLPIHIVLLDEVTGIPYNQKAYPMQRMEPYRYSITIRVPHRSIIKYRYSAGENLEHREFNLTGKPVKYRMFFADGPGYAQDVVAAWNESSNDVLQPRITGRVIERESGDPISDLLVTASGISGMTAADGSFRLEGIPPGKHHMVVYSMDGRYYPYQQEVITAADTETPVQVELTPTRSVEVTFELTVPEETVPTVPIKIAGSLYQLGNTFGELASGMSLTGDTLPQLEALGNGRYAITMALPAGIFIEYKYTMGDGFWNAEHRLDGRYMVRNMILPLDASAMKIEDEVLSWRSSQSPQIWFDLAVQGDLPADDSIYIQFKLVEWMEPLPMWAGDAGRWGYLLNSPTNFSAALPYRFCRRGQCGPDVGAAVELNDNVHAVQAGSSLKEILVISIDGWKWDQGRDLQAMIPPVIVNSRSEIFVTGVEMADYYRPQRNIMALTELESIVAISANTAVLTPSWSATLQNPPLFDPLPAIDMMSFQELEYIQSAQAHGLGVILAPRINLPIPADHWWATAQRDFPWWQVWFEQYRRFILHHAALARDTKAAGLVLDGTWLAPAFVDGTLLDESNSNVPPDAGERWAVLMSEIRAIYSGELFIRLDIEEDQQPPQDVLNLIDGVFLNFSAEIGDIETTTVDLMAARAGDLLDQAAYPYSLQFDLKVIVAIAYSSADGAATGCISNPSGSCIPAKMISPFGLDFDNVAIDLHEQAQAYNAVLMAVNERPWVSGVVSLGYYPTVELLDKSLSVHGKPAQDVLSYWYRRLSGAE